MLNNSIVRGAYGPVLIPEIILSIAYESLGVYGLQKLAWDNAGVKSYSRLQFGRN